ncbi:MAG TPA: hypothetical protein PKD27_11010 [Tepidiformaceae bacterium]|mgnify:CR=1 FL=1|nr:hypothetical protein [Tepidiformaceae bacterium]
MRRRYTAIGGVAALTFAAAFVVAYMLRDPDTPGAANEPPGTPDSAATVDPNSTPDTSRPGWHIPYLNEWEARPKFAGTLNGFEVNPAATAVPALEVCPTGLQRIPNAEATQAVRGGDLQVDVDALPPGVTTSETPLVWLCEGAVYQVVWNMSAAPGTADTNPNGSPVFVHRVAGKIALTGGIPEGEWETFDLDGRPGIGHDSVVSFGEVQFGACTAALYDPASGVMTVVTAAAANLSFCKAVLEGVVQ